MPRTGLTARLAISTSETTSVDGDHWLSQVRRPHVQTVSCIQERGAMSYVMGQEFPHVAHDRNCKTRGSIRNNMIGSEKKNPSIEHSYYFLGILATPSESSLPCPQLKLTGRFLS